MSIEESLQFRFKRFINSLKANIFESDSESISPAYQRAVESHIVTAQELWEDVARIGLHNVATSTDTIDDLPTSTLELLRLPYVLGDLWSRVQGSDTKDDNEDDDPTAPAARKRRLQRQNAPASSSSSSALSDRFASITRAEALTKSQKWFEVLMRMVVDLELMQAKDIEIHLGNIFEHGVLGDQNDDNDTAGANRQMNSAMASRTAKIQLSQHQRDISKMISETENEMAFRKAKAARMRRIVQEDRDNNSHSSDSDEDNGEGGVLRVDAETGRGRDFSSRKRGKESNVENEDGEDDADEELRRTVAILYLKWCTGEAIQNIIMSRRELEMVSKLTPEQRKRIADEYQQNIELWAARGNSAGKQTYTILPGGLIAPGDAPMHSSTFGTNATNFREQVRAELMVDRNRPTMTLEEYAQMEMAGIAQQQQRANDNAKAQAEEDLRLGEDGIEERERKKQADWDDWRDAHPAYGITNKGNYS